MRVLYGGTFDPVHQGHMAIARAVAEALNCEVKLVPSADPPHRVPPGANAEQRATMLSLAVGIEPGLAVDRRELDRNGPSYTVDTLEAVRAEVGLDAPVVWVLGIDSLLQLDSWRDWRRIFDLAHVLGVERPGTSIERDWLQSRAPVVEAELAPRWCLPGELRKSACGAYAPLTMRPLRDESATEVRRRIGAGLPWDTMVPPSVARYIRDCGLYRTGPGP